ncbi:MAG: lysylphosphatidylglycerol synthase transmembrane domain-containing protein [Planctomycetota bacterium]
MKLIVTVGLIAAIVRHVEWAGFARYVGDYPVWLIAAVVGLWAAMMLPSVEKWRALLAVHGLRYPFGRLLRWYFIGSFYNQVLPTMVGGDAYRVLKTLDNGRHRACAVLPVFIERVTGLSSLVAMGAAAAAWDWAETGHAVSGVSAVAGAGFVAAVAVGGAVWARGWLGGLAARRWCPGPVRSLVRYGDDLRRRPGVLLYTVGLSVAFHLMRVLIFWLLLWGIGADVGFGRVTVVAAATMVIGMLPISLGGWGLVDGAFLVLMEAYGVPAEAGLTAALMSRVTVVWVALAGGLMALFERRGSGLADEEGAAAVAERPPEHLGVDASIDRASG